MSEPCPRVLIVEDELILGLDLLQIVRDLGFRPVGPIAGVAPAVAVVEGVSLAAAILDVMLDDGPSFVVADALDRARVLYVFLTAVRRLVEAEG